MSQLSVAIRAAQKAREIIKPGWDHVQVIEEKNFGNLVSKIDIECDKAIQSEIHAAYPDDAILYEELSPDSRYPRQLRRATQARTLGCHCATLVP